VHRVVEVRRLDHVVLLVAAQAVLGAEGGGQLQVALQRERIERVREVRVTEAGWASSATRLPQSGRRSSGSR